MRAILEDDTGALWVGTSSGGLNRLDARTGRFERFRHEADVADEPGARPGARAAPGRRRTAVGRHERRPRPPRSRPRRPSRTTGRTPRTPRAWPTTTCLSLAQDRGGVLWVGTRLGGVHKWNPLSWQFGHVAADPARPRRAWAAATSRRSRRTAPGVSGSAPSTPASYVMDRTTRRDDRLPPRSEEARQPRQRPGDGAAPRPPRRPLDRRRSTRASIASTPASGVFQHYRSDPKRAGQPERRTASPRSLEDRDGTAVAGHLRRRARQLRSRDGALHATTATTRRTLRA